MHLLYSVTGLKSFLSRFQMCSITVKSRNVLKHSNSISVSSDAHTSSVKISLCNSFEGSIDGACYDGV